MSGINFSGIASGIDGNAIIQATMDAKALAKVPFQNKLTINEDENTAFKKLKELLAKLDSTTSSFQTYKGSAVTKTVVSGNEDILTAAVSGNAPSGTLSVRVNQLASSGRLTFDNTFSNYTDPIAPGLDEVESMTVSIGIGESKKDFTFNIDSSTTLGTLVDELNTLSEGKFTASVINIGTQSSPAYKLMFSGQETGVEKGTLAIEVSSNLQAAGIFASSSFSQAVDAIVDVAGVGVITRGSNVINDIFPGLSVEVKQVSTTPVILKISNDIDKTTEKVSNFVLAYNELKKFIDESSRIDRVKDDKGDRNVYGPLARSRVDNQLLGVLREAFRSISNTDIVGGINVLADLGIKTDRSGMLEFDDAAFKTALGKDPNGAGALLSKLGDRLSSTNGVINSFSGFQGIISQAEKSNKEEDSYLSSKIERIDVNLQTQKEYLTRLFSKLEETVGKMQASGSALTSLITQTSKK